MSAWTPWKLGAQPVPDETLVDVQYRNGNTHFGFPAGDYNWTTDLRDYSIAKWRLAEEIRK